MQNRRLEAELLRRQAQQKSAQPQQQQPASTTRELMRKVCQCLKCKRMRGE